jgi:hypothetical protein
MNLRELLLQFEGEIGESLKLEDLLLNNISGIEIEEELANGVKILIENPDDLSAIKELIHALLEKNGYKEYSIKPQNEKELQHLIIEIN